MEFNSRFNRVNRGGACAAWPPGSAGKAHVR